MLKAYTNKFIFGLLIGLIILTTTFVYSASQDTHLQDTSKYENIAKGKPYTFNIKPNYAFCSDPEDKIQLTDGIYTSGYFWTQKTTVGWQKSRPVIMKIDLGKVESIRGISFNTAAGVAGGLWPVSIQILLSDDGKQYFDSGDLVAISNKRNPPPAKGYAVHRYWIDSLKSHGRFVQLVIDPGFACCFVDEIEVYRGEHSWITYQPIDAPTLGGIDFFKSSEILNSIKSRLNIDLQVTKAEIKNSGLSGKETAKLLAELKSIETSIPKVPPVAPISFVAVFPINDLHARIYAIRAKIRRLAGVSPIETWVSHPLDYIAPSQKADSTSKKQIDVAMMRGEWRSAVFNVTNSYSIPARIQFSINGLPKGTNPDYVSVYEVQWTDTKELKPIGAALKQMLHNKVAYTTIIPAGMTRQIWLSFHPINIMSGYYQGNISLSALRGNRHLIALKLRVFPFDFPKQPTLHVGGFDYTDADKIYDVTVKNREVLIAHLQERFVDSPWATSRVMPFGKSDSSGNFIQQPDTSRFDAWISRWPKARRYCVAFSVSDSLDGSIMGSDDFNKKIKHWIDYWVKHVVAKGITPDQLVLGLLDEPRNNDQDRIIIAWSKAIRAAQPKVMLWEDPTYLKPEKALPEMMSSVDVLCPNRVQMLSEGKHFEDFYRKQKSEGRRLELYSCSGPMHLLDPYSYVRLQAWTAWDMGAEATSFWAFGDTGGGNPWNPYAAPGVNYAPMFLAPDSVTPGKHTEALRESVEDFEYFVMLKDAIAKAKTSNSALPKAKELLKSGARRVLDAENANKFNWSDDKNRWIAEEVRLEILETLVALEYRQ